MPAFITHGKCSGMAPPAWTSRYVLVVGGNYNKILFAHVLHKFCFKIEMMTTYEVIKNVCYDEWADRKIENRFNVGSLL